MVDVEISMNKPLISVVIPFYGRREWLVDAVESVLEQTCRDFEIVLVDDGSPQPLTAEAWHGDRRVQYTRIEHVGRSAARNIGLRQARGEFIAFLDADDLFVPTKLELQAACMQEHPDIPMSHSSYLRVDAQGSVLDAVRSGTFSGCVYPAILKSCPIATPTVMLRRRVLHAVGGFDERIHVGEDILLWARIARSSEIVGIDEPLVKVRIHGDNANCRPEMQIQGALNIIRFGINGASDLSRSTRRALLSWHFHLIAGSCLDTGSVRSAGYGVIRGLVTRPWNTGILSWAGLRFVSWFVYTQGLVHLRRLARACGLRRAGLVVD